MNRFDADAMLSGIRQQELKNTADHIIYYTLKFSSNNNLSKLLEI